MQDIPDWLKKSYTLISFAESSFKFVSKNLKPKRKKKWLKSIWLVITVNIEFKAEVCTAMGNGNGSGLSLDHLFRWQEKFYSTRLITLARVILHSFLIRWRQVSPQHHNASSLIITFKSSYQTLIPYISVYFFLTYTSYIICNCIHKRWWVCIVYKSTHITAEATDHSKRLPPPNGLTRLIYTYSIQSDSYITSYDGVYACMFSFWM